MDDSRCQGQAETSNRVLWDEMARVHIAAYAEVDLLRRGEEILDPVELRELGDVRGKTMLRLQCHTGTDTLAWARRGAVVTGVDFSGQAIACAERLRDELGLEARFLESNVYDLTTALDGEFDVAYTSRGILCRLRDLNAWARIVAHFLKPGGCSTLSIPTRSATRSRNVRQGSRPSFTAGFTKRSRWCTHLARRTRDAARRRWGVVVQAREPARRRK